MSQRRKSHYLHRKLTVSMFWAALLFAVFASTISFFAELKRADEKNRVMIAQLLDTVESTATVAAYSGNRAIGEDVLKGLLRNDIVHAARLFADQHLDLRQTRDGVTPLQNEIVRILRSPFGDGEVIGILSVIPEPRFSLLEARYGALLGVLNSTAVVGLTALILLVLVRSSLSRPLQQVSNALHAIKAGEKERLETLPRHQDDELGQLVRDINGLLDTAQEKFEGERRLLRQIQAVEQQLRGLFENTSAGIFLLDAEGRLRTANPTLGRVLGLPKEAEDLMAGQDFAALAFAAPEQFRALMRHASQQGQVASADLQLRNRLAETAWVHCLLSSYFGEDGSACFEGVVYDITERRATEMRFRHEADHDTLTGLHRRQAIERDLGRLLEQPPKGEGRHVLLLLDLDNFKQINDSHGHAAGDVVLVETAKRLKACVRSDDRIARLGGDEFVIVLVNCVPLERAIAIARQLIASITQPIALGNGLEGQVGVSIGIAVHDEERSTLDELLKAADLAMYEVKRQGKNGFGLAGAQGDAWLRRVGA